MDPVALIATALGGAGAGAYILKRLVDRLLDRGKVRIDEAAAIRAELRSEIDRKNKEIEALEQRRELREKDLRDRIENLEEELEKTERERNALDVHFAKYKLDVYRMLVSAGVDRELLDSVLALQ